MEDRDFKNAVWKRSLSWFTKEGIRIAKCTIHQSDLLRRNFTKSVITPTVSWFLKVQCSILKKRGGGVEIVENTTSHIDLSRF